MTTKEIDAIVCWIMRHYGPDRHIDGHQLLTGLVEAVAAGRGQEYFETLQQRKIVEDAEREADEALFQ